MTIWPAWQHFEEHQKGSIEVGKLADLVILSDNPMTVPEDLLDDLKVLETYKEGVSVYQRSEGKAALSSLAMFGVTMNEANLEGHYHLYNTHAHGDGCFNNGLSVLVNAVNHAVE